MGRLVFYTPTAIARMDYGHCTEELYNFSRILKVYDKHVALLNADLRVFQHCNDRAMVCYCMNRLRECCEERKGIIGYMNCIRKRIDEIAEAVCLDDVFEDFNRSQD